MKRLCSWLLTVSAIVLSGSTAMLCQLAPYPAATITVGGAEQPVSGAWDNGTIMVDFNGYLESVRYGQFSTPASLASGLAAMFSRDYHAFGLYAKAGAHANQDTAVITFQLANGHDFGAVNIVNASASFALTPSGFGSSQASPDRGTVLLQLTDNSTGTTTTVATTAYGDGSTPATIAEALAVTAHSSQIKVHAEGANVYLDSLPATGAFSYTYNLTFQSSQSGFPQPSFGGSPASGQLSGATEATPFAVYSYSIPSYSSTASTVPNGYDVIGNVTNLADSVMGVWSYGYDSLNRLTSGQAVTGPYTGNSTCWTYDSFGNQLSQSVSTTPCSVTPPATFSATYGANNRVLAVTSGGSNLSYDDAGNVKNDGRNVYLYDAEGRLCAVHGPEGMIGYQYDAGGARIGKGLITTMSCDLTANGYQPTNDYVLDLSGGQMTELAIANGTPSWTHTNVTANGALLATFDALGLHFHLTDALGSRRVQTDPLGFPEQTCQSLAFGDELYCTGSLSSPTEHHFTGKERDTESGLDYFGGRYYASNIGRFMSPDQPFADQKSIDPQSWNLYSYVRNNPLRLVDPTGNGAQDANSWQLRLLLNTQYVTTRNALIASNNSSPRELEKMLDAKSWDPRVYGAVAEATAASFLSEAPTGGNMSFTFQPQDLLSAGIRPDIKWQNTNNTVFQDGTGVTSGTSIYLEVKAVGGANAFANLMTGAAQTADTAAALAKMGNGGAAALVVDTKTWGGLTGSQQSSIQSAIGGGHILQIDGLNSGTTARINGMGTLYKWMKDHL